MAVEARARKDQGAAMVVACAVMAAACQRSAAPVSSPTADAARASDAASAPEPLFVDEPEPCGLRAPSSGPGPRPLDLGHARPVAFVKQAGDRLLSREEGGHWVLWSSTTGQKVAEGFAFLRDGINPDL